jgi:hypothetical protein
MLTNEQADESYQQAFAALHSVVIDPAATPSQQGLAREKRDMLTLEFIGQAVASVEERTRRFQQFIGEMNTVIAAFGSGSTIAGIRRLQAIVDMAGGLIGAALVPLAPARSATKATKRTKRKSVKRAKKKAPKKKAGKAVKKAARKPAKKAAKKAAKKPAKKAAKKPAKKAAKKATRRTVRSR